MENYLPRSRWQLLDKLWYWPGSLQTNFCMTVEAPSYSTISTLLKDKQGRATSMALKVLGRRGSDGIVCFLRCHPTPTFFLIWPTGTHPCQAMTRSSTQKANPEATLVGLIVCQD